MGSVQVFHLTKIVKKLMIATILAAQLSGFAQAETQNDKDEQLVALVNGIAIKQYEYDIARQNLASELEKLSAPQQQQRILKFLIDMKLMSEAARNAGVDQSKEYKQKSAYLAEQSLNNLYFTQVVLSKIDEAEIFKFYQSEMKKIKPSQEIRAAHILLEDESKADEIFKRLAKGDDFAAVAEEYSTGPSKTQGGDLGYFGEGEMVPEFMAAAVALEKDDYTKELVKTSSGFHIIKLLDKREKPLPSFDQLKENLYRILVQQRVEDLSNELRQSAKIELFIEQEVLDQAKQNQDTTKK